MTFNAERKINNPAKTKTFKSNNFNLGDICSLKLIFLKYFNKKLKKSALIAETSELSHVTITLKTQPQPGVHTDIQGALASLSPVSQEKSSKAFFFLKKYTIHKSVWKKSNNI